VASCNVLVTGANGLLGQEVCNVLHENNMNVIGLSRRKITTTVSWHSISNIDLATHVVTDILKEHKIDIIVHCAAQIPTAQVSMEECVLMNDLIDKNLLQSILDYNKNCKLIFISSCSVYGAVFEKTISEDSILNPANIYSEQKLFSEKLFVENLSYTSVFRINAPYSKYATHRNVLRIFLDKALHGEPVILNGEGGRRQDFIHASDVGRAIVKLIELEKWNNLYNVACGSSISMKELAKLILKISNRSSDDILLSGEPDAQENQTAHFDISKAKNELLWQPSITLEQGLTEWMNKLRNENSDSI
jgi:UDP-glucose 4-epimerase